MMTASPSALKGPKLTLMVNSAHLSKAHLSRLDQLNSASHTPKPAAMDTPSSTIVEYGGGSDLNLSAADRADRLFVALAARSAPEGDDEQTEGETPIDPRPSRKPRGPSNKVINERVTKFLQTISQAAADPNKELVQENRGLHQRISILQTNEQHLLKDNQDLNHHVATLKKYQDAQQRQFRNDLRQNKASLEARIRALQEQLSEQDEKITQLTLQASRVPEPVPEAEPETPKAGICPTITPTVSDSDITSWFATRGNSWSAWAGEFAHHNPRRVSELHPVQQKELRTGVQHFVRLAEDGKPPKALGPKDGGDSAITTRLLLQGMLANFIISEAFVSPFWIFTALSKQNTNAIDSPMPQGTSILPIGFSMDMALWSNSIAPMRSPMVPPPAPATARSISLLSPRHPPPLITSMHSLGLNTMGLPAQCGLPGKSEIENLFGLLLKIQAKDDAVHGWRSQMMQILCGGGLGQNISDRAIAKNEDKLMLASARREYARRLKERFLGGAARFLLQDQDADGIAKLEGGLTEELDLALRFSGQIWARAAPLGFVGMEEIASQGRGFTPDGEVMELCQAQKQTMPGRDASGELPVLMVLQPAVGALGYASSDPQTLGSAGKVWAKAQVFVAAPAQPPPTLAISAADVALPGSPVVVTDSPTIPRVHLEASDDQ